MKACLFLLFLLPTLLRAEIVTLISDGRAVQTSAPKYADTYSTITNGANYKTTVEVRTGEVARVLYAGPSPTALGSISAYFLLGTISLDVTTTGNQVIVGPCILTVIAGTNSSPVVISAQITRNDEPFTPAGAVLVPADSSGPVRVIMESSTNLVQWNSALPGTYGTTAQNQYFRVRAERQ
jgi:hypothetical protein